MEGQAWRVEAGFGTWEWLVDRKCGRMKAVRKWGYLLYVLVPHSAEGGAVLWLGARAGSAPGLGTPSSAEAGCVQGALEPGAKEDEPRSASRGS